MQASRFVARFDSASAMLRAVARFLHGRDFPALGSESPWRMVMAVSNAVPGKVREALYRLGGWSESVRPQRLDELRSEDVSRWVVGHYPRRKYPAAMIGSSNGATVHLCCALGIPWLPQTLFFPVSVSDIPVDDFRSSMEFGRRAAEPLLRGNPDLHLCHMHDPNQDRLMIRKLAYFRAKRLTLGDAYAEFLTECVEPGGTLFVLDCGLTWPGVRAGERHIFQIGAYGGARPEEYVHGGPRVEEFLSRYGSDWRRWDPPEPDGEHVEAEWGLHPALRHDIEDFAKRRGFRVRRIAFREPQDLSGPVADLYRWWHRSRGLPGNRLIADSFIIQEPWWTLRTGSVPFWNVFAVQPAVEDMERYLDGADPFDDIHVMLFSHGTDSIGLAPIDRWRSILRRAGRAGRFAGVNERTFPRDFAVFVNYYHALKRISERYPMPEPLTLAQFDSFLDEFGDRYPVTWE